MNKPKQAQQSGQINFKEHSIIQEPMGKTAKVIPAFAYNPLKKAPSKRDLWRMHVRLGKPE